jgi:hypothetical protein
VQQRVAGIVAGGERDRAARGVAPACGAGNGGRHGIGPPGRVSLERLRRGGDPAADRVDPLRGDAPRRLGPATLDAPLEAAHDRLEREAHGQVGLGKPGDQVLAVHLVVAHRAEPAAQAAQAAARLVGGFRGEERAPGGERLTESPRGDAQVVDGFGIASLAHALRRRRQRRGEALQFGGEARGERGVGHGGGRYGAGSAPSDSWEVRASRRSTRVDRSSAVSSTGRVASSISKP